MNDDVVVAVVVWVVVGVGKMSWAKKKKGKMGKKEGGKKGKGRKWEKKKEEKKMKEWKEWVNEWYEWNENELKSETMKLNKLQLKSTQPNPTQSSIPQSPNLTPAQKKLTHPPTIYSNLDPPKPKLNPQSSIFNPQSQQPPITSLPPFPLSLPPFSLLPLFFPGRGGRELGDKVRISLL